MYKFILLVSASIFLTFNSFSQDASFSQITNNKLYLNPAFTNSIKCPELTMTYRNQWPSLGAQYVTSMLSYEQSIVNSRNGVGITLLNDRSENGIYSLNGVNLFFSNQQKINNTSNIKFGLDVGYKQTFIDDSKLFFEDSFNGQSFTNMTNEPLMNGLRVHYFDIGAGILYFNDKGFLGFAVNHLNEPNQSLIFGESFLPKKFGLHGGINVVINNFNYGREEVIYNPSFSLLRQGEFTQLTLNNNIKKGDFLFGAGLNLVEGNTFRDALIFNFGINTGELIFFYSYDVTISHLGPTTGGAHEITTVIKIDALERKNKITVPACSF